VKLGPSVAWLEGGDREEDGERAGGTGRRVVSAGAQAWFKAGAWSVVLNYMGDAYVENGTRGHLARLKLVRKL
jgi:hypothetical protein